MPSLRRTSTLALIGPVAAGVLIALNAGRANVDPDLWGHLKFGFDFLATGTLAPVDPYSFTQGLPWINHEWLSETIFALAYRAGGVAGLIALKTMMILASVALVAPLAFRADPARRWWLLALVMVGISPITGTFRPQLWTIVGVAAMIHVLSFERSPFWIVILLPLWANVHGGWIVGVGYAGCWTVGRVLDTRSLRAVLPVAVATAAGVIATILNPYGWRLWAFLAATVRMEREITEWRPLWQQLSQAHLAIWVGTVAVLLVSLIRRWRNVSWAAFLPMAWLAVSALLVDRLLALFCLAALPVTSEAWRSAAGAERSERPRPFAYLVVDGLVIVGVWLTYITSGARCMPIEGYWVPDVQTAGALTNANREGRLVLPFEWGEYAIWHWSGRYKVSIDGRRETIYTDRTIKTQNAVPWGRADGIAFLEHERPEFVWLSRQPGPVTERWLRDNGYRIDVESENAFIATRSDLPPIPTAPPASACFP